MTELWDNFTDFKSRILEPTTIHNYKITGRVISQLPSDPIELRDYLLKNYSYSRAKEIIDDLSRCLDWAVNSNLISENKVKPLKLPQRKKSSTDKIACYTLQQRDLIIVSFENHPRFSYYANFIKFLFWTGCRPGEAFALTWGDISADCSKISIDKSFASKHKLIKGTKNSKSRVFPAMPDGKLNQMLLSMREIRQFKNDDFVFTGLSGQRMSANVLEKIWRGHSVKKYFYPGVVRELAEKGQIPFLKPYSTRHTFATWAIASGASVDKVAYWLGDDIQTVLAFYCHPEVSKCDCPDF